MGDFVRVWVAIFILRKIAERAHFFFYVQLYTPLNRKGFVFPLSDALSFGALAFILFWY